MIWNSESDPFPVYKTQISDYGTLRVSYPRKWNKVRQNLQISPRNWRQNLNNFWTRIQGQGVYQFLEKTWIWKSHTKVSVKSFIWAWFFLKRSVWHSAINAFLDLLFLEHGIFLYRFLFWSLFPSYGTSLIRTNIAKGPKHVLTT